MKSSTCIYQNILIINVSDSLGNSTDNGSCDGPASSSSPPSPTSFFSLTTFAKTFLKFDFHMHFFCLCTGASDTSTCCFSASVVRFVIRVELTTVSITVAGAAAGPGVSLSDSRDLLSLLRALGSAGHGTVGLGQAPAHCSGLGLPGLPAWQNTFSKAKTFTSFSGLCTC